MISLLFAQQMRHGASWSFADIAIAVLIILGILGIVLIVSKVVGFQIPPWVWQILGIVVAVGLGIIAIRFLTNL